MYAICFAGLAKMTMDLFPGRGCSHNYCSDQHCAPKVKTRCWKRSRWPVCVSAKLRWQQWALVILAAVRRSPKHTKYRVTHHTARKSRRKRDGNAFSPDIAWTRRTIEFASMFHLVHFRGFVCAGVFPYLMKINTRHRWFLLRDAVISLLPIGVGLAIWSKIMSAPSISEPSIYRTLK